MLYVLVLLIMAPIAIKHLVNGPQLLAIPYLACTFLFLWLALREASYRFPARFAAIMRTRFVLWLVRYQMLLWGVPLTALPFGMVQLMEGKSFGWLSVGLGLVTLTLAVTATFVRQWMKTEHLRRKSATI